MQNSFYQLRCQAMWGILLIACGTIFLLDRMDMVDASSFYQYWPLVVVLFGVNKVIGAPSAKDLLNGMWEIFFGLWVYACIERIWDLRFTTSWPALLIAWGIGMVLKPFLTTYFFADKERKHEQ